MANIVNNLSIIMRMQMEIREHELPDSEMKIIMVIFDEMTMMKISELDPLLLLVVLA